jgi:hypothetical protein
MRIAVGKVCKIRIPQYFSSMSMSEAPRGRGRDVRGWGIGVLEGGVCARACMRALGCVCVSCMCMNARAKGNGEHERKPEARKENRSAKVRGVKARNDGGEREGAKFKAQKRAQKRQRERLRPGTRKRKREGPKKRVPNSGPQVSLYS